MKYYSSILIGCAFLLFTVVISLVGLTVVPIDQYYKRHYLPWCQEKPDITKLRSWNIDDSRDGDCLLQLPYTVRDHLIVWEKNGRSGSPISFDTLLAYQMGNEYNYSNGLLMPISKILIKYLPGQYHKVSYIAINLTAGLWGTFIFIILWLISDRLFQSPFYNSLIGISANPVLWLSCQETFCMGLAGFMMIALALLLLGDYKILTKLKIVGYHLLAVAGGVLILRSGIFQYFVYLPLLYLIFSPVLIKHVSFRLFVTAGLSISISYLIEFNNLLGIVDLLNTSNKVLGEPTLIEDRGYNLLPFNTIISMPLLMPLMEKFGGIFCRAISYLASLPTQGPFHYIGFSVGILAIIRFWELKNNWLKICLILIVLYYMGPLQYLLSVTVPILFATESSSRIWQFLYIIAVFLAVDCFHKEYYEKHKRVIMFSAIGVLLVSFLQVEAFYFMTRRFFWIIGFIQVISSLLLCFYFYLKIKPIKIAFIAILIGIVSLTRGFIIGDQCLFPMPVVYGVPRSALSEQIDFKPDSVGALAVQENDSMETLHPNFWYDYDVRSVHAYRNPYHRNFTYLFWYQWCSYNPEANPIKNIRKELQYQIRYDWLEPIKFKESLSPETYRFFDLCGVDYLATGRNASLKDKSFKIVYEKNGLKIWKRESKIEPLRIVSNSVISGGLDKDFKELFSKDFDLNKKAIINKLVTVHPKKSVIESVYFEQNAIKIKVNGAGGLLCTNIPYYDNFRIEEVNVDKDVEKIVVNTAFLGFCVSAEKGIHIYKIYFKPYDVFENIDLFLRLRSGCAANDYLN